MNTDWENKLCEAIWDKGWESVDNLSKSGFGRHKVLEKVCEAAIEFIRKNPMPQHTK